MGIKNALSRGDGFCTAGTFLKANRYVGIYVVSLFAGVEKFLRLVVETLGET
jgi:hypothetical protein